MTKSALDRLLFLRRRREEKSLEALTVQQAAHRRARSQAEEAQMAVVQHAAASKDRERALVQSLMGKDITQAALRRLQDSLDTMAFEQGDLRVKAETARQELAQQGKVLDKARKLYRQHHSDAERLKELLDQENAKAAKRRLVIDEIIEEDQTGLAAPRSQLL